MAACQVEDITPRLSREWYTRIWQGFSPDRGQAFKELARGPPLTAPTRGSPDLEACLVAVMILA